MSNRMGKYDIEADSPLIEHTAVMELEACFTALRLSLITPTIKQQVS
jgi:hypothetical protein